MIGILDQGGQIGLIQDNIYKGMGCQPVGGVENNCAICWSGAFHNSCQLVQHIWKD
jgi:hypothetical protein